MGAWSSHTKKGFSFVFKTIISVAELKAIQSDPELIKQLIVFDCSFDLADTQKGLLQFKESHIKGALFANLDKDLSTHNPDDAVNGGRHPLPQREIFAQWLSKMGVTPSSQVVVYDRQGNNFCGRLWWMLKWCGLESVAVLDGGLKAWTQSQGIIETGEHLPPNLEMKRNTFKLQSPLVQMLTIDELKERLISDERSKSSTISKRQVSLIDARATPRFNGEVEPLDPLAGHIPGALNRPFNNNLTTDGFFKSSDQLRSEFELLLNGKDPHSVVHQCGSGVSAVPNLLAMHIAGFGYTTLYPGSWSEWSRVEGAPVERTSQTT